MSFYIVINSWPVIEKFQLIVAPPEALVFQFPGTYPKNSSFFENAQYFFMRGEIFEDVF